MRAEADLRNQKEQLERAAVLAIRTGGAVSDDDWANVCA
jgi:hypothetical protein